MYDCFIAALAFMSVTIYCFRMNCYFVLTRVRSDWCAVCYVTFWLCV